jgi:hypothetical protein
MVRFVCAISRACAAALFLTLALATVGCGDSFEGTYHNAAGGAGGMTLDFKGNKVTVTMLGETKTLDYKVESDAVTILNPSEGNLVLTRNSDGTLNSNIGTFAKR